MYQPICATSIVKNTAGCHLLVVIVSDFGAASVCVCAAELLPGGLAEGIGPWAVKVLRDWL